MRNIFNCTGFAFAIACSMSMSSQQPPVARVDNFHETFHGQDLVDAVPFQSERFVTEQVWYPSKDRTSIPMFLMHEQARKMTARLQAATTSNRPVLLLYDAAAGHAGGGTFQKQIDQSTDELTFVASQLGVH